MYEQAMEMMTKAENRENPDPGPVSNVVYPMGLLGLMQEDLGVKDGIVIDTQTGLRKTDEGLWRGKGSHK
jgi:hypothetical protein